MITIRRLISLHTLMYFLAIAAITIGVRAYWSYPEQKLLTTESQRVDLIRTNIAINSQVKNLAMLNFQLSNNVLLVNFFNQSQNTPLRDPSKLRIINAMNNFGVVQANILVKENKDFNVDFTLDAQSMTNESFANNWKTSPIINFIDSNGSVQFFEVINNKFYIHSAHPILSNQTSQNKKPDSWLSISKELDLEKINHLIKSSAVQVDSNQANIQKYPLRSDSATIELDNFEMSDAHALCLTTINANKKRCLTIKHDSSLIPSFIDGATLISFFTLITLPALFFFFMLKYFINPLERSTRFLKNSAKRRRVAPMNWSFNIAEIESARLAYNQLMNIINEQEQTLEKMSNTDKLTNIANRRAFDTHLYNLWRRLNRQGGSASLIMIDIDYFKRYNDRYGHVQGDKALQGVASVIKKYTQRADEVCARFGGEEFSMLVQTTTLKELNQLTNKINSELERIEIIHDDSPFHRLTLSIGICTLDVKANQLMNYSQADWLHQADLALYKAKNNGRNTQVIHHFQIIEPQLVTHNSNSNSI